MVNVLVIVSKYDKAQSTVLDAEQRNVSSAEKSVTTNFIKYNYKINEKHIKLNQNQECSFLKNEDN